MSGPTTCSGSLPTPLCYGPLLTLTFSGPPSHSLVYTGDSDDEVEESVSVAFPDAILEPKDPYSLRPLPLRIGTAEFLGQDDVGLVDYASDTEGMCSKRCTLNHTCMYTKRYHTCMCTKRYHTCMCTKRYHTCMCTKRYPYVHVH